MSSRPASYPFGGGAAFDRDATAQAENERSTTAPQLRRGAPRPAAAYVSAATAAAQQATLLSASAADPRFPWREALTASGRDRARAFGAAEPAEIRRAVARVALTALSDMLDGIERYQNAPPPPSAPPPPAVWRAGSAKLLDFGAAPAIGAMSVGPDHRPAALVLPSLINRARILDLTATRSLMRGLVRRGVRPFLLDWGAPGPEEAGFSLEDYVLRRAAPALEAAAAHADGRAAVIGHCMSGPLALATAQVAADPSIDARVTKVAAMGAPWRFSAYRSATPNAPSRDQVERLVESCGDVFGGVPTDVLNTLFFLRDPLQALRKYPDFAALDPHSARARLFVAVEDWLNDGVPLTTGAARTLLIDWGHDDLLAGGRWRVEGEAIAPGRLAADVLLIASKTDTLVPYASATGLFADAPQARLLQPSSGHVGMIVGRRAEEELWNPLAAWIKAG